QTTYTTEIDLWISQYTDNEYIGNVKKNIEISEKGSKIRVALETVINGTTVYFIKERQADDTGSFPLDIDFECSSGGTKTVRVYINNIESYTFEVEFIRRSDLE
ncbi:MAG: hypothetical protein PHO15_10275, partial [Eubacteriales bacterium]|nr:hypothetical protein [Eubacteriales bacterium]